MVVPLEEGMGENSPTKESVGVFDNVRDTVYDWLVEKGNEEAIGNPRFKDELEAHFCRFPPSYVHQVNLYGAEGVLLHRKILAKAKESTKRPAFHVRPMKNTAQKLEDVNVFSSGKVEDVNVDMRKNTKKKKDKEHNEATLLARHITVHEITFSTVDNPKLLGQLSSMLWDIRLHLREAHVFTTTDGYSLGVFVVNGWADKDISGLCVEIEKAIATSEGFWSGSSHSPAAEKRLAEQPIVDDWEIDMGQLTKREKLATGASGDLYRGSYHGQDVAIKILNPDNLDQHRQKEFEQEVRMLREVKHRNVVPFLGAWTKSPEFCIVTEYMPGGSLHNFLRKRGKNLELSWVLKFALDVCKGMVYLHQNEIIHRDLKTSNLLLDNDKVVKVADFGLARFLNQGGVMTPETGTYRWMAPEVLSHKDYDLKADVYSFAIVLWELTTSKYPYAEKNTMQAAYGVVKGERPKLPERTHPKLLALMKRCWDANPAVRPFFSEIEIEIEELLKEIEATEETIQGGGDSQDQEPDQ